MRDIFLAAAGMIYSAFANEQEQENAIAWFNDNFEWRECASVRRGTVAVCATACTTIGAAASLAAAGDGHDERTQEANVREREREMQAVMMALGLMPPFR